MKIKIVLEDAESAAPVRVESPDGEVKWDLLTKSCTLVLFEIGTKVTLYEPITLVEACRTEVTRGNVSDNE